MYNVTNNFKTKIQELTRVFTINIKVRYKDNLGEYKTITLEDGDISSGSFTHEEASQGSDEFTVGGVVGGNISFSLINDDKFKDIDFIDARVTPTVGLIMGEDVVRYETWMDLNNYTWDTMTSRAWGELTKEVEDGTELVEYVPLGVFNVDTVNEHRNTTEIRAIDDMLKLDKSYDLSNMVYPATLKQIYINLCNVGEVSYKTNTFVNDSYVVDKRPEGDYSLRDILSFVAEASGTFAQFNRLGALELKWYDSNSVTITPDNRSNFVAKKYKVQISGISKTIKGESEENDTVYLAGDEGYVIDLSENPLLQNNFQQVLQTVYNKIKTTVFTPYESTWQGNPAIQAGDKVTHVSVGRELENGVIEDGEVFDTIITNSRYVFRGAGSMSAHGLPANSRDYSGSNINKIRRQINIEMGREVSRLDKEREQAGQLIANMLGGYFIPTYDAVYIANAPTLEEATKVWKWGIGGFGYFPEGIYDKNGNVNDPLTGITAEGSIVAELVAAGIVSAEYIETGILSSFGGEAWINLDNGHFKLGGLMQDENGFRIEYGGTNLDDELTDIKNSIINNEPTFMWIKYSNESNGGSPDGSDMRDDGNGMTYIGIASNKGSSIPSMFPSDYSWSKFKGEDGEGKGIESITEWYLPSDLSSGINIQSLGWNNEIVDYNAINKYLWNYEVIKFTDNTTQETIPRIIGVWGEDGVGIESITEYYLASPLNYDITNESHGFSTTPYPVDEINPYLWNYEEIKYTDGKVHKTEAMIVGVFGKDGKDGLDGYDGISPIVGILSNEHHVFVANKNGFVNDVRDAKTTLTIYEGTLDVTDKWNISYNFRTNLDGELVGNTFTITSILGNSKGRVTLIGKRNGYPDVEKEFRYTVNTDGKDSTSYWINLSSNVLKEDTLGRYTPGTITVTSMKQVGDNEPEEHPCLFWISETATINDTPSRVYSTPFGEHESSHTITPSKGITSMGFTAYAGNSYMKVLDTENVIILRDGIDGEDGHTPVKGSDYFDGRDGQDGVSQIIWIRYSDYEDGGADDGSDFYVSPEGREYIGIATTTTNVTPKNPNSYTWSKYKGTDGVRGEDGEDGKPRYIHIKYSNDGGATLTYNPSTGVNDGEVVGSWMGVYVDEFEQDSTIAIKYTWNRVKGSDGEDGKDGKDGIADNIWIMYSNVWNGLFMDDDPTDKKYMGIAHTSSPYRPVEPADYIWSKFVAEDGVRGLDGNDSFVHIKYSNDGGNSFTENNGENVGEWIGIYTDDKRNDSNDLSKYKWQKVKGEKGEAGRDGINVSSVDVEYRLSDSRLNLTSNYNWKTTLTESDFAQGKFIWSRVKTTYSMGSPTYSSPSLISGNSGSNGSNGINGRGVSSIEEQYYLSYYSDRLYGGSWSSTPPPWRAGRYMWTRSRIYYTDGSSNYTNEEVDRAWETINGINTNVVNINQRVDTLNGVVSTKVSVGDLGSEFYQSGGRIRLNARNIDLVGSVNVLSELSNGKLGTITAGDIHGVNINGGTIYIGSNAFRVTSSGWLYAGKGGFSVPPNADGIYNNFKAIGDNIYAARWKYNDAHYIYQDNAGVTFNESGSMCHIGKASDGHARIRLHASQDRSGKILKATGHQMQVRSYYDNSYGDIAASDFVKASERKFKTDICDCHSTLDLVNDTKVFNFKFKDGDDKDNGRLNTGFIVDSAPKEIVSNVSEEDKGISIMDSIGVLWKAVQELSDKVDKLEGR